MKKVIIIIKEDEVIPSGSLTAICENNPLFSYHYLKGKKFPFEYKGWSFRKVPYLKKKKKKIN